MDRDTIIRLAREAGLKVATNISGVTLVGSPLEGVPAIAHITIEEMERVAALVEAHLKEQGYRQCAKGQKTTQFCGMVDQAVWAEREACAKVCDEVDRRWINQADKCAQAIRSRT